MCTIVKSIFKVFLFLIFFLGSYQQVTCQEKLGSIGIGVQLSTPPPFVYKLDYIFGASLYNGPYEATPALGTVELTPDILISTWLTDKVALEPSIGLMLYKNQTQWRLGVTVVNHFGNEKFKPFVLFQAKIYLISSGSQLVNYNRSTKTTNYLFGLGVGGEYFIVDKFSVSGCCQLNYLIPDKNGLVYITDNAMATGATVCCRFYLK